MSEQLRTAVKIKATANQAYDAFVYPDNIRRFWFPGSSATWKTGAIVTLSFPEYGAEGFEIRILEATEPERIIFLWGEGADEKKVEIKFTQHGSDVIVEVIESGWNKDDLAIVERMLDNKGGWTLALVALKAWLENGIETLGNALYMGER